MVVLGVPRQGARGRGLSLRLSVRPRGAEQADAAALQLLTDYSDLQSAEIKVAGFPQCQAVSIGLLSMTLYLAEPRCARPPAA
jgi:hypothetical protein